MKNHPRNPSPPRRCCRCCCGGWGWGCCQVTELEPPGFYLKRRSQPARLLCCPKRSTRPEHEPCGGDATLAAAAAASTEVRRTELNKGSGCLDSLNRFCRHCCNAWTTLPRHASAAGRSLASAVISSRTLPPSKADPSGADERNAEAVPGWRSWNSLLPVPVPVPVPVA